MLELQNRKRKEKKEIKKKNLDTLWTQMEVTSPSA